MRGITTEGKRREGESRIYYEKSKDADKDTIIGQK